MNQADRRRAILGGTLALGAFIVYGATLAPGLTWLHDGADGGDLARAAALGSVPHPTGYPTYLLLARLFLLLPVRDEAFRLNLMSAVCTAAAIGLFGAWQARPRGDGEIAGYAASATGALALAFAPLIWSQAVITEVYGLQLLCAVAFLAAWSAWRHGAKAGTAALAGLVGGIGLGNHVTLVFLAPVLVATAANGRTTRREWLGFLAGLAAGLGVYAYLPLANATGAPSPWGPLDSPGAWASYVTGEPYRPYLFTVQMTDVIGRLLAVPGMAWNEFAPWGIALAAIGGSAMARRASRDAAILGACALLSVAFSVGYNTADAFRYLTVAWLVIAVGIAEGGRVLAAAMQKRTSWAAVAIVVLWGTATAFAVSAHWDSMNASAGQETASSMQQTLATLPPESALITRTDRQTFALWYYIDVRHARPDVVIVDQDLFSYAPYRDYLSTRWRIPADVPATLAAWLDARGDKPIFILEPGGNVRKVNAKDFDASAR